MIEGLIFCTLFVLVYAIVRHEYYRDIDRNKAEKVIRD